jgi:tRNA1Val (adenine37-N6)-methyltransferase
MIRSDDESCDAFFDGRVTIYQSRAGHRFSLDALLLAHFVTVKTGARIVDLGTGNGVIPLALAILHPSIEVTGIELQASMVERARRNIAHNKLQSCIKIAHGDVRSPNQIAGGGVFDAAICNPPYRKSTSGRLSANRERQMARHEIAGGLSEFLEAGSFLLRTNGRMAMVYGAVRSVDLLTAMRHAALEPKRLRYVHSFARAKASLVLVEAIKAGRSGIEVLPPLIVYQRAKTYSAEAASMIAGARRLSGALEVDP